MVGRILLSILGLGLIGSSSSQVIDCAPGATTFTINSQGFSPFPPVAGENTTLWIDYTVPEGVTVNAGLARYTFTLNGIPFSPSEDDLCTQITCPQVPGTFNLSTSSLWPTGISGKITSKIQWFDSDNTQLLCSQLTVRSMEPEKKPLMVVVIVKKYLRGASKQTGLKNKSLEIV